MRMTRLAGLGLLLSLLWLLPQGAMAGDKLRQLKLDVAKVRQGTLLIAPVLPDSFVLRHYANPGKEARRKAYLDGLQAATRNIQAAVKARYSFSKYLLLPAAATYADYKANLAGYDAGSHYVLQLGHMAQFMGAGTKRASNYDKAFLGIYALDGTTRMVLHAGKAPLFAKADYAQSIIESLQKLLERYAGIKRGPAQPSGLAVAALEGKVAVLPTEALPQADSAAFRDGAHQTVVTTLPLRLYRYFGGAAVPGGTWATTDSVTDVEDLRRKLGLPEAAGNSLTYMAVVEVPVATKLHIGLAAARDGLPGGGAVVILPTLWPTSWISRIHATGGEGQWTIGEFEKAFPAYFKD